MSEIIDFETAKEHKEFREEMRKVRAAIVNLRRATLGIPKNTRVEGDIYRDLTPEEKAVMKLELGDDAPDRA